MIYLKDKILHQLPRRNLHPNMIEFIKSDNSIFVMIKSTMIIECDNEEITFFLPKIRSNTCMRLMQSSCLALTDDNIIIKNWKGEFVEFLKNHISKKTKDYISFTHMFELNIHNFIVQDKKKNNKSVYEEIYDAKVH